MFHVCLALLFEDYTQPFWTLIRPPRAASLLTSVSWLRTIQLRKGKALRKHSLHAENSHLGFIELFINGNERGQTTGAP